MVYFGGQCRGFHIFLRLLSLKRRLGSIVYSPSGIRLELGASHRVVIQNLKYYRKTEQLLIKKVNLRVIVFDVKLLEIMIPII